MTTFSANLTAAGLALYTAAVGSEIPVQLTAMAVGDGNGNPTTPNAGQTALVREVYRGYLSGLSVDEDDPTLKIAEFVIPPTEGGWVIREVGIFTIDGTLFAVANFPETEKPLVVDGSVRDLVIKFGIKLSNAAAITITVDVNIVTATRAWVLNTVTAEYLLPGGLTNQLLGKASNADGDFEWVDLDDVNVTVDVVEEPQTLAALQVTVVMAITSTRGLAVYIEGVRINRGVGVDDWAIAGGGTSLTTITLGKSYPAGTMILMVQNEPAGALRAPLERLNNLSDVDDVVVSRTNLGVYSKAESDAAGQAGLVCYFARSSAPTGWLKANGAAINRTTYAVLFAAIGTTYGAGNGTTTFNIPELRGEFLRALDDGRGIDTARALGSAQSSQNLAHIHTATSETVADHNHNSGIYTRLLRAPYAGSLTGFDTTGSGSEQAVGPGDSAAIADAGGHTHVLTIDSSGGAEARPRNVALLACIKY